jgi:sulfite dehydrogenase (quinone) subunit SoeC
MNPAYSVILFTTASGAGYGLLALLGLVGFNHGTSSSPGFALTSLFVALALITVGLLSSTFHLGHPERAWRAFSQWRSSWLSREGVAAVITYPIALAFGAVWSGLFDASHLIKPLAIFTAMMCAVTVICTAMIYRSLKTIRAWNNSLTLPVYLLFALATGSVLLMAIASAFGRYQVFQMIISVIAIIALLVTKMVYWKRLREEARTYTMSAATGLGPGVRQWEVPHTNVNFIMKEMGYVVGRRHAEKLRAAIIGLLLMSAAFSALTIMSPRVSLAALATLAVAAWMERWLFFAEAQHVVSLFYGAERA